MRKAARITFAIVVATGVIFGPAIYRTFEIVTSSARLIVLAGQADAQSDLNPWSDFALVHPDGAVWMLRTFDFPYRDRTLLGESVPLMTLAVSSRSMSGSAADQRLLDIVKILIERGESLEDRLHGFTALQGAILLGDAEMARLLVEAGASLEARIERPDSAANGMTAFELNAQLVNGNHPEWHAETAEYLRSLDHAL